CSGIAAQNMGNGHSAVAWLLDFCSGHPLSLRLVGSLLRYFKSPLEVAERIQKCGVSVLKNPTRQTQTKNTSLAACLAVAYSALSPEDKRVLFVASHCPAGCLIDSFHFESNCDVLDLQESIATLRRWHLMYVSNPSAP